MTTKSRKRKRNEDENQMSNKLRKEINNEKENDLQEYSQTTNEPEIKFPKEFQIMRFRKQLKTGSFIEALRHFLYLANNDQKIVAQYIQKRGNPQELSEAFELIDKKNLYHISYLCEALNLVLIEILANENSLFESTVKTCRYFLKNHNELLESLIKSPVIKHRKCTLKLLTSIVMLEPQLGKQILKCFDSLISNRMMEQLLLQTKNENNETESIRKCYIHFILSYLIDENIFLTRNILDKCELIGAILKGLIYDDHITICVVLNSIKRYILESPIVPKTKKIHIFEINVVHTLIKLYDWKNPTIKSDKSQKPEENGNDIDSNEKQIVVNCVHEFLVILLSSRKYGIVFDAMENFKQRNNIIPNKALLYIKTPWINSVKTDLVIKILVSCPELAKHYITRFVAYLIPHFKLTNSDPLDFLAKVISQLHPSVMRSGLDKISLTEFTLWVKSICLPFEALVYLRTKYLKAESHSIRIAAVRLLYAMFQQYCNYMNAIIEREKFKGNDLRKFKFDMFNHLFVNFPSIDNILVSLFYTVRQMDIDRMQTLEFFDITFSLILLLAKTNRGFIDKTLSVVNYITIMKPIYESRNDLNEGIIGIEMKAVNIILILAPYTFKPNEVIFNSVIDSFINIYIRGNAKLSFEAGTLLKKIFLNTNFFENSENEIDIWLVALKFIDLSAINEIQKLLINSFSLINSKDVISIESDFENFDSEQNIKNIRQLFENIENDRGIQSFIAVPTMSKLLPFILENNPKLSEAEKSYIELVSMLIFHYLPTPYIVEKIYSKYFNNLYNKYMINWLHRNKPGKMKSITIPNYKEMYSSILNSEENFDKIFGSSSSEGTVFIIANEEKWFNKLLLNKRYSVIFIHQIIFIVSQLTKNYNFEEIHINSCSYYLEKFLIILNLLENEKEENLNKLEVMENQENYSTLHEILKYIYCKHLNLLQSFNILSKKKSDINFIKFILHLTKSIYDFNLEIFDEITFHYRSRIITQIKTSINEKDAILSMPNTGYVLKSLETFQMTETDCCNILETTSNLIYTDFFDNNGERTIFYDIIVYSLNRLTELKKSDINHDIILNIVNIYVNLIENDKVNCKLEHLEETLNNFLNTVNHFISLIKKKLFTTILNNTRINKITIKLAILLLERRNDLNKIFKKNISSIINKKELFYPLLSIYLKKNDNNLDLNVLNDIYREYKNGILKSVEKPQKIGIIYKENYTTSIILINNCMPISECLDFTKKNLKIESVEICQMKTIEEIYRKAIKSDTVDPRLYDTICINFLSVFLNIFNVLFKKDIIEYSKVISISYIIFSWFKDFIKNNNFDNIIKTQNWQIFCKNCLKITMQETQKDNDDINGNLIKILAFLCKNLYKNNSNNCDAGQLFEMITTHSRFFEIVLTSRITLLKTQIMNLIYILIQKNQEILNENHIPIFLGSYQAKLNNCDRYILAILQYYEQNGISLYKYRPFIWGDYAISYYSLKNIENDKPKLIQEEPSVSQVMMLIEREISEYTIENFPIWRKLNTLNQIPDMEFFDNDYIEFGTNILERKIEQGCIEYDSAFLNLCHKKFGIFEECYDPAFFIPLMIMSFSPELYSHSARPIENGLLGITFSALSSQDKAMRLAAGCAHQRYRQNFESKKFLDKSLWIQSYENIQNGLAKLREESIKHKRSSIPRVPYISGLFLAKTINMLNDPLNPLYRVLAMYLRVHSTFDFLCIPEFYVLFHSSEVDHHIFRRFIIEIIRDGIKCSSDLNILLTKNTFRILMSFYNTPMCKLEMNLLILSIFSSCVKIPATIKLMIENVGIIPWLNSILSYVEYFHFDTIEGIIAIINNLWYSLKAKQKDFIYFNDIEIRIFFLLVKLCDNLSNRITLNSFTKFINILTKTVGNYHQNITEENLNRIISCGQKFFNEHMLSIINIKSNGSDGIENDFNFISNLKNNELDSTSILALVRLREFVIGWKKSL